MNSSVVSPWHCVRQLNLARSTLTIFWTLNISSILPRTCAYLPLSASLMLLDVRMSTSQGVAVERWPTVLHRSIQPLLTPCGVVAIVSRLVTCTQDYYSSQE